MRIALGLLMMLVFSLPGCYSRPEVGLQLVPGPRQGQVAADTVTALPPGALDSLRAELARLQATLDALGPRADTSPADTSRADTSAAPAATEVVREAREAVESYGLRAFFAVVVLILAHLFIRGTVFVLDRLSERNAARRLFYKRLVPIVRIMLWIAAATFVVRGIFEVSTQGLIAAAAAIGVAIGFAAQDLLKNLFGGLVIVFDQPFQVGDKVAVGGTYGEVVGIGLRSTRIVTPDDNLVSVPNSQVVDGQVANANAGALDCQVVTDLYLPGWVDEAKARQIAYEAAASSKYVYLNKPIVVLVKDEFNDTFVTHLKVKAYVLDTRYEFPFMSDVTERARAEFRRQGLLRPWHGARAFVDVAALPYDTPTTGEGPASSGDPGGAA